MQSTELMSPLAAATWHKTLSQTDGRDKLFRLIQYACKLLRGLDHGRHPPPSTKPSAKLFDLERALATSRQIWRLFKWASIYVNARPRATSLSRTAQMPDLAALLSDAGLFGYYLCDNITFLAKLGLLRADVSRSSQRAARFWLAAVVAGLAGSLYRAVEIHAKYRVAAREARAKGENDDARLGALLRLRRAALAVCAKHAGDSVVAWSLSRRDPFHPAVVGACGTLSSVVGFWQVWPRYMSTG